MKKGKTFSFLRVVNEIDGEKWSQVYAREPWGEEDKTGVLYGVIGGEDEDKTKKESEILMWLDGYYNEKLNTSGLTNLGDEFVKNFADINVCLLWAREVGNSIVAKIFRNGEAGLIIKRGDDSVDFWGKEGVGKVVVGELLEGDSVVLWTGGEIEQVKKTMMLDKSGQEKVEGMLNEAKDRRETLSALIVSIGSLTATNVAPVTETEDLDGESTEDEVKDETELKEVVEGLEGEGKKVLVEEVPALMRHHLIEEPEADLVSKEIVGHLGPREKLVNWWSSLALKRSDIAINRNSKKRLVIGLGVLFVVLLVVSVVVGSIKIESQRELKRWNSFAEPIEKKINDATGLVGVNLIGARKMMEEAKASFDSGKAAFTSSPSKDKLMALEKRINDVWQQSSGEREMVGESSVNFALVREGYVGDKISFDKNDQFVSLESKLGLVVTANISSKDVKVLVGKGEGLGWRDVVGDGKRYLVMDGKKVMNSGKNSDLLIFDSAVVDPVSMGLFGSNLYVLDAGNKDVYKYTLGTDSTSERSRWLKQGQSISQSVVSDMAIDGDIWVVGGGSVVERFRRGVKENFSLNGTPDGAKFAKIAVDQESEGKIALLDSSNGWVVTFKKSDGSFIGQFKSEKIKQGKDIEFDQNGKLWLLAAGQLFEMK